MARVKQPSLRAKVMTARQRVASLEEELGKLERSRPRTRGKKSAKTKRLSTLKGRLRAARGLLTKALGATKKKTQKRAPTKSTGKKTSKARSAAVSRGWETRRANAVKRSEAARKAAEKRWAKRENARQPEAASRTAGVFGMRFFLVTDGAIRVDWVSPPAADDRRLISAYWFAVAARRSTGNATGIRSFENCSIYDGRRDARLPFVTDLALIDEAIETGLSDFDELYRDRNWSA